MTKHVSKSQGQASTHHAPEDDCHSDLDHNLHDDDDDVVRRSDRRKPATDERAKSKAAKAKPSNQDKSGARHESSQERRERRLRERREREAVETERRERERDFARKRHTSVSRYKPRKPPAGYKDPNEVCRQPVPGQVREERRRQMRALMNCIAFEPPAGAADGASGDPKRTAPRLEEMDNSLSSDTTSDMTDVTPRSSSSGCSSMSKQSTTPERTGTTPERTGGEVLRAQSKRSKSEGRCPRERRKPASPEPDESRVLRREDRRKVTSPEPDVNGNVGTDADLEEMRYLQEAFEDFDLDEEASDFATSIISGLSEERRAKCGRKNMTFTNDQLREIERVNLILLKKIMAHRKPRSNGTVTSVTPQRKTSAAVNRARTEKNIEKDNMVLLRKLQTVKGTTTSAQVRKPAPPSAVC